MSTFKIDYDKIDVEAIMAQIRQRVKEKTGVVYSQADLDSLANQKLASPSAPERHHHSLDPDAFGADPERAGFPTKLVNYIEEKAAKGERWNVNFDAHDLIRSHPGPKGKLIESVRKLNRKFFKLTMNFDILIHEIHRQASVNDVFVEEIQQTKEKTADLILDIRKDLRTMNTDVKKMSVDIANQGEEIQQLRHMIENLRGLVEGQRQQTDYMLMRQSTLEKLAVLKEDEEEEVKKNSDLIKGRYIARDQE